MKTIAFFSNKGGVGKTTLLYHLAWMFSDMGVRTVAVDLDPQSSLTALCLRAERLRELWDEPSPRQTIAASVQHALKGADKEVRMPHIELVSEAFALVPGDIRLASLAHDFAPQWSETPAGGANALRMTTLFHRIAQLAGERFQAKLVFFDTAPNFGGLNRCALLAVDSHIVPVRPDLFMVAGLGVIGSAFAEWRRDWRTQRNAAPVSMLDQLPSGHLSPAGYIVTNDSGHQRPVGGGSAVLAKRIPREYRIAMGEPAPSLDVSLENDPYCLAQIKYYHSLMPMAMEVSKPIFHLKPADGAIGAHAAAVADCAEDFRELAKRIAEVSGFNLTAHDGGVSGSSKSDRREPG